jgi:hypothetical protein
VRDFFMHRRWFVGGLFSLFAVASVAERHDDWLAVAIETDGGTVITRAVHPVDYARWEEQAFPA